MKPPPLYIVDDRPSFVCMDCAYDVFQFPATPLRNLPRCATCQWLADMPDAVNRERVRQWLNDLDKR